MFSRLRVGLLTTASLAFLYPSASIAQIVSSRLTGVVKDSKGAVVEGARVTAVDPESRVRMQVLSEKEGWFVFASLPPGEYTITVDAKGFRTAEYGNVVLNLGQSIDLHVDLESAGPSKQPAIRSFDAQKNLLDFQVSRTYSRREIEMFSQLDRTPLILAVYQPGVQVEGGREDLSRVGGMRQGSNNLRLDSMDINDPATPRMGLSLAPLNAETVAQFRVVTGGWRAEYGRNPGAQLALMTRRGGNRWSLSAYEFLQNAALNANDFFNNAVNARKPKDNNHAFGFSLGGPVIRDRTAIFGNYEGKRAAAEVVRNRTVLTANAKKGLFSWLPSTGNEIQTFDIAKNDPRSLGIDPRVAAALALLPNSNNYDIGDGPNTAGYRFNNPVDGRNDQFTVRIDHSLSNSHRLFYRHSWSQGNQTDWLRNADASFPGQSGGREKGRRWGFSFGSDWAVKPKWVNEFRAGLENASISLLRPARQAGPMMISGLWTDPLNPDFPSSRNTRVYEFANNMISYRGSHALKAGVNFRFITDGSSNSAGIYPDVTFGTSSGNVPPANVGPGIASITADERQIFELLYNALLGRMEQVTQTYYSDLKAFQPTGTPRVRSFGFRDYGVFLQDDWRLKPDFSVSFGVRYEYNGVPYERSGLQGVFDQAAKIDRSAQIGNLALQPGRALYSRDGKNFAPRLGFAWNPRWAKTITVRGSYGIYYDRLVGAATDFVNANTTGLSQTVTIFPNLSLKDVRLVDGVPVPARPAAPILIPQATRSASAAMFDSGLRTGRVQQFSLWAQKEILRNTVVEAGYVGTRGDNLFMNLNLNQLKIDGDFLKSLQEIRAFRNQLTPVPASNSLVRIFGSVGAVVQGIGGSIIDRGLAGTAANIVDRGYFSRYGAAGISDFYLRNFPQYDKLMVGTSEGSSFYDSFQMRIRHQISRLRVNVSYTYSKSVDNISLDAGGFTVPIDNFDPSLNKGRGDADRPHVVASVLTYTVPSATGTWLEDADTWMKELIGGWDIGALLLWEEGAPFSVSSGRQTTGSGTSSWADYSGTGNIGSVIRSTYGVYYFYSEQINAFSLPAAGKIGTSGRNRFRGPRYFNMDMSLAKRVRLGGTREISLRFELYNMLNRTNFSLPKADLSSPNTFGRISSTAGIPRTIQAALRFSF